MKYFLVFAFVIGVSACASTEGEQSASSGKADDVGRLAGCVVEKDCAEFKVPAGASAIVRGLSQDGRAHVGYTSIELVEFDIVFESASCNLDAASGKVPMDTALQLVDKRQATSVMHASLDADGSCQIGFRNRATSPKKVIVWSGTASVLPPETND